MDEMVWLSKEFVKERKWKQTQCRKFARLVERSKLDVESRRVRREEENKLALRKKASELSRMVMTWWSKIERVVVHKQQYEVEKIEKHRLDKRLDKLVAKTERCSKLLASRVNSFMGSAPRQGPQPSTSQSQKSQRSGGDGDGDGDGETQTQTRMNHNKNDNSKQVSEVSGRSGRSMRSGKSGRERRVTFEDAQAEGNDNHHSLGETITPGNSVDMMSDVNSTTKELDQIFRDEASDAEYFGTEEEAMDDEATMIEEEKVAEREGNVQELTEKELSTLKGEGEMPIEEILKRYYGSMDMDTNTHVSTTAPERRQAGKGESSTQDRESMSAGVDSVFKEEKNDAEYFMSEDEEDDERTFAEEERLARKDGNVKQQEALEIDALQKESEIPIEELLARYKAQSEAQPEDQPQSQEGNEEARPMTRKRKAESLVSSESKRQSSDLQTEDSQGGVSMPEEEEEDSEGKFKPPFILKGSLREYQLVGLQWLAALRQKSLNGILADEMGLGKTIQTIALLADLACNHGYWGPHLIVVPTSVMLNWEMEFKKWCPAFKILTYYGTAKQRQAKRQGWSKFNSFNVCITTYTLILQDKNMFRRKKWDYLILDEAHMIKNWQSQRWQTLLRFNARRRILLTGTPLQNNLMELWSLMHFLMPKIFESHDEFKEWFNNPLTNAVEGQASLSRQLVKRLHGILRPFILRRLKAEVEKSLPGKFEHIVYCKLSKRQRNLYEDYVGSSDIQKTLAGGNYFSVFNVLMQLRKVCNHPDLFEGRAIKSAFDASCFALRYPKVCILDLHCDRPVEEVSLCHMGFVGDVKTQLTSWDWDFLDRHQTTCAAFTDIQMLRDKKKHPKYLHSSNSGSVVIKAMLASLQKSQEWRRSRNLFHSALNAVRCGQRPLYTRNLIDCVTILSKN